MRISEFLPRLRPLIATGDAPGVKALVSELRRSSEADAASLPLLFDAAKTEFPLPELGLNVESSPRDRAIQQLHEALARFHRKA